MTDLPAMPERLDSDGGDDAPELKLYRVVWSGHCYVMAPSEDEALEFLDLECDTFAVGALAEAEEVPPGAQIDPGWEDHPPLGEPEYVGAETVGQIQKARKA